jgi:hypothetical protein
MHATGCEICRSLESVLTCPGSLLARAGERAAREEAREAAEGEDFSIDEWYSENNGG